MKPSKKIISCLAILALPAISFAQCSVCAAGAASSQQAGSTVSNGINNGILYLLVFPYLIFMGFMIYRYREFLGYQYRILVQRWRMFRASL
jgi:hypothetical protein